MRFTSLKITLLANISIQFLSRLVSSGLSFLITLLLIRYLGISFYGRFVQVTTLLYFGYVLVDLGLNAVLVRQLSRLSLPDRSSLLSAFLNLRFFLALTFLSISFLWFYFFRPPAYLSLQKAFLFGSVSVFLLAIHLTLTALFQLHLAYYKSALANIVGSLTFFLLTLILIFNRLTSLPLLILANTLGFFATALVSLIFARQSFTYSPPRPTLSLSSFRASLWMILTFIFSSLANRVDVFVASFFRSSAEIGQYGFAYKILEFIIIIPTLFMNVLYPLLLKPQTNKAKLILQSSLYLLATSLFFILLLYPLAPLILLLKPQLRLSVVILRLLLFSLPLFYLTSPLMWFLVSLRREKTLALIYFLATLLNLSLNFLFLPRFSILASAWVTLATEAVILLLLTFFSLPHLQLNPKFQTPNHKPPNFEL